MRTARKQSVDDTYHVIVRGTGRQLIFEDDGDRRLFLAMLCDNLSASDGELYAWCLMDNHAHLLIHAPLDQLAACMRRLCGAYAQRFNEKCGRVGHLFQDRFKSEPVNEDAYLLTVIRYIHANPVKAGMGEMQTYPWSSYRDYLGADGICAVEFPLAVFGGVEGFVDFHRDDRNDASCMETEPARVNTRAHTDEAAASVARATLGGTAPDSVKAMGVAERRAALRALKEAGLSTRQIERLTGIGRTTISRA